SAHSASDGTLRFLALTAALMEPDYARFYFIDELENGIHPARAHLLLQLIEQTCREEKIQVLATSHSSPLLGLLSRDTLEHTSVAYRLDDAPDTRIQRILDIPDAKRVIKKYGLAGLHAEGWLENALSFTAGEAA